MAQSPLASVQVLKQGGIMSKWTKEPWHTFAFEVYNEQEQIIADCGYSEDYWGEDGCKANAARIVACVNACEGMQDPAKEIEESKRHYFMDGYNAGKEDATESCEAIMQANLEIIANKILNCDFDDAIEYIKMLSEGGQQ